MSDLVQLIDNLTIWKHDAQRAPHKPLLLLLTLGHYQQGGNRIIPFEDIEKQLRHLLEEFGPFRQSYHPEYPFWRLQGDGLWELENTEHILPTDSGDPRITDLRKYNVKGGLLREYFNEIIEDKNLFYRIVYSLLESHLQPSMFDDILSAAGIEHRVYYTKRRARDPNFRELVLKSYQYKCAICEFQVRLRNQPVALEAAHIQWHNAGGPDIEPNGIALCTMHHKLFDQGAFTLDNNYQVQVSEYVNGGKGLDEWLLTYHDKPIHFPRREKYYPEIEYVQWHVREVFKGRENWNV